MSELRALKERQEKDTTDKKVGQKVLLDNIKASIDPILKFNHKSSNHIGIGAHLKIYRKRSLTDRHVHFASTPVKPEVSNIHLTSPPHVPTKETITESILQNTMQTLSFEFKHSREPKMQKFRGVLHLEPSLYLSLGCNILNAWLRTAI